MYLCKDRNYERKCIFQYSVKCVNSVIFYTHKHVQEWVNCVDSMSKQQWMWQFVLWEYSFMLCTVCYVLWFDDTWFDNNLWWCSALAKQKYFSDCEWQWMVCTSRFRDWYVTDLQVVQCGSECVSISDKADLAVNSE